MKTNYSEQGLIDFENDISKCFEDKMIRAPIHLTRSNEKQLIEIFKEVKEDDWCCLSWRSHYHSLLKGMPKEKVKEDIINCRSIEMCNKKYRIFSSAIVGGNIPIATGMAMDIKRRNQTNMAWCFIGDMTSMTGGFRENLEYCKNWELPIRFVIENNGVSVKTNTYDVWNTDKLFYEPIIKNYEKVYRVDDYIWYYFYKQERWQHAGTDVRIQF